MTKPKKVKGRTRGVLTKVSASARAVHYHVAARPHAYLTKRSKAYAAWHTKWYHKHVHFGVALLTVLMTTAIIGHSVEQAFASGSWVQTDWSGGTGTSTSNQYSASSNVTTSTANRITLTQTSSPAWYNASWKYRQSISFNNTTANIGTTAESLSNFPVMVKLTSSNFDFTKAQSAGQDIRFTASDGTTLLSYEIESWNSSTQQAIIWVNVPTIAATNSSSIEMYYGNSSASDAQNKTAVWDSNYLLVQHMDESTGTTNYDSTSYAHNSTKPSSTTPLEVSGELNGAQSFNGATYTSQSNFIGALSTFTVSHWINLSGSQISKTIFSDYSPNDNHGWVTGISDANTDVIKFYLGSQTLESVTALNPNTWYLVSVTYNNGNPKIYINGQLNASSSSYTLVNSGAYGPNTVGAYSASASGAQNFNGSVDELRISNVARDAAYEAADYASQSNNFDSFGSQQLQYPTSSSLTSSIYDTGVASNYGTLTYAATVPTNTAVSVLVRAGNQSNLSDAPAWTSCSAIASGSSITSSCAPNRSRYVQYQIQFTSDGSATPTFTSITIPYTASDVTPPPTNASNLALYRSNGGASIASNGWTNGSPYFTWTAGADDAGGSGIAGYCLYLGQDPTGNPVTTKGDLGSSPLNTSGACPFAVSTTNLDTSVSGYIGTALTSSTNPYYLNIKAIDNAGNIYTGSSAQFQFKYDNTVPTNPAFITAPSEFVSSDQVNLTWPTTGSVAASDDSSGVAGLQYRIGASGTWYGANHSGTQDATDLLSNNGSYTTIPIPDYPNLQQGNNIVYFRTWDNAGNVSAAYVTTVIKINSTAPSSPQNLTATPTTNTTNSFAFSWLAPASFTGSASNITYCYTINVLPTANNCTYTTAGQTSLAAGAYATEPGDNTMYVVAKDEAGNINYATAASATFTANTPAPGIPLNLDIADISIKSTSSWKLALSWNPPSTVGAGIATYKIYRSTDGNSFTNVASTAGASYVDTGLNQQTYYYEVRACDSANNCGGTTNIVSLLPTGKFTSPANLISGPTSSVSTRTATITWDTDRDSDSRVEYGLSSGNYSSTEAANSDQVASHSITLNNLQAGTTYYYRTQWDDTDGNIGSSSEQSFTTLPAPTVSNVSASNVNLHNATIEFTATGASAVKLYYGTSSSFGSVQTQSTSTITSTYAINLTGLNSGTSYYYKLDTIDSFGNEYNAGQVNTFATPPQPTITNVAFSPVTGALTGTEQITWTTNVPATSQISYGLVGGPRQSQLDTTMTTSHSMTVADLTYNTQYSITATSIDALGNEADSDLQVFKSGIDTKPPTISSITIQPSVIGTGAGSKGQLIVSWKPDKAGTSQVAYGSGTSGDYSTKTAENTSLVNNHVVVVSGLSPSEVYHLQVISSDAEGIKGVSPAQTTIIGQASDSALSIIFNALQSIFGLGG